MKKIALITAAALLASAGTYAFAQGAGSGGPGSGPGAGQAQGRQAARGLSQDEYNRLVDARIAAIKAGLKLNADQERLWAPVETAIRANATERFTRFQQRDTLREQRQSMDFMQRLEMRGTMMTESAQRSSALSTALRPLWNTFSEDQKRIAPRLMRSALGGGGMGWDERGGRRGRDGEHHRGERGEHGRMGMMHHGQGMMGRGGHQAPAQPQQ